MKHRRKAKKANVDLVAEDCQYAEGLRIGPTSNEARSTLMKMLEVLKAMKGGH